MSTLTDTSRPAVSNDVAGVARVSSWILLVGYFLVTSAARAVYIAHDATPSARFEFLCVLGFMTFLWYWLKEQCRPHGASFPIDMPFFAASLWFVLIPYYLWRYERWRGLLKVAILTGAYLLCYAVSVALYYVLAWTSA